MAVHLSHRNKKGQLWSKPFLLFIFRFTSRYHRIITIFCFFSCILLVHRHFRLISQNVPPTHKVQGPSISHNSEGSVNLWRRVDHNCPPEHAPPDPALYGTSSEQCFSLGLPQFPNSSSFPPPPGEPAAFWQMNSRAMCYFPRPVCLYGRSLQSVLSFDRRGTGSCSVVQVERGTLHDARLAGLNESCAAFRTRYMASMYGREMFYSWDRWRRYVSELSSGAKRKPVVWESDFAILIPKYPWSYNICHYNRIWNFVIYVIRNLKLFVPDSDKIKTVNILFRSGYAYNENWHKGIRNATLNFLERQVGMKITVGHLRFNYQHDFQCLRRGILLGREGRIDSLPFLNDSSVWQPEMQRDDSHWPAIPHDSLWFREAVLNSTGLGTVGKYSGPGVENFLSVPVPPRRVAVLLRSERSRRRLSKQAHVWFHSTLSDICTKHSLDLVYIRNTAKLTLKQQVEQMRNVGFAVGLHGANMVNTVFMPPGGAVFEIFPWKYVRFYYASGGNSGLRYSFHEPESGIDRNCSFSTLKCFMRYRESVIFLSPNDRAVVQGRLEAAVAYIVKLHRLYPTGHMPLRRKGNSYHFGPAL